MEIRLLNYTDEEFCINGARTCYMSHDKATPETNAKLCNTLKKHRHLSVFEHGLATFYIKGISLNCSHQLVRHRLLSFSQRSGRYVKYTGINKGNLQDYISFPEAIKNNKEACDKYTEAIFNSVETYNELINLGIKKEDARSVLPQGSFTELQVSGNYREWLHVIDVRVSAGAQWEIRDMSVDVWKELYKVCPKIFGIEFFEENSKDIDYKKQIFEEKVKNG